MLRLEPLHVASEGMFDAFEAAKEGVWELYPQDGKTFRSQSYLNFLGYGTGDDSSAEPSFEQIVIPDDFARADNNLKALTKGPQDVSSIDVRMQHRDGHIIHTEIRSRVAERDQNGIFPHSYSDQLRVVLDLRESRKTDEFHSSH